MFVENTSLIFDLDGTLSDPSTGICRCFNFALETRGFGTMPADVIASEIGPPLDETFHKFAPEASVAEVRSLITIYRERYAEIGYSENVLYPGVQDAIAQLSSRGLHLGICTSKRQDFAQSILDLFNLSPFFEFVDGGDVGVKKREQLLRLVEAGQIDKGAIMIGDRSVDILAARSNGLRSIGVLWGFGSSAELADARPDYTVEEIDEIVQLVI